MLVSRLTVAKFRHSFADHRAVVRSASPRWVSELLVWATANILRPESSTFPPAFILESWDF